MRSEKREILTFKGFDTNFQCRGFQYEVGKTYIHNGPVKACSSGFHSCSNPLDVLGYYDITSRFASVIIDGELDYHDDDSKIASSEITIEAELKLSDFIDQCILWSQNNSNIKDTGIIHIDKLSNSDKCVRFNNSEDNVMFANSRDGFRVDNSGNCVDLINSGYDVRVANSGDNFRITNSRDGFRVDNSGNCVDLINSGDNVRIANSGYDVQFGNSGNDVQFSNSGNIVRLANSGDNVRIANSGDGFHVDNYGNDVQIEAVGESNIISSCGLNTVVRGGKGCTISLSRWVADEKRYRITVAYVGENGIKEDTWYTLDDNGDFVEVAE